MTKYLRIRHGNANFTYIERFADVEKAADQTCEGELVEVKVNAIKYDFSKVKKEDDTIKKSSAKAEGSAGQETQTVLGEQKKSG